MSGLERRYRRLLRWFPWEHRERHEEEMLSVLMAAARLSSAAMVAVRMWITGGSGWGAPCAG
ncbi:hypothetical protein ABZ297_27740 [Nonomuraea sp. NPDC005983]|uniref:hypothetical protein n=1 Tax=Nonomuraea sp. NPDC005983 TaxID=3155595 RepID=UPI0033BC70E1